MKWLRASTIPATGLSKVPSLASSRTICAPSSDCRSAPRDPLATAPCSILSATFPNPLKSWPSPTRICTSTENPRVLAASWATLPSVPLPPNASRSASPNSPPSSTAPISASTSPSLPRRPCGPDPSANDWIFPQLSTAHRPRVGIPWRTSHEEVHGITNKLQYYFDAVQEAAGEHVPLSLQLSPGQLAAEI